MSFLAHKLSPQEEEFKKTLTESDIISEVELALKHGLKLDFTEEDIADYKNIKRIGQKFRVPRSKRDDMYHIIFQHAFPEFFV